jgi:hypothetical protein
MNDTPQNLETLSTLGQHKTDSLQKYIFSNFISKDCLSHVEFETSFGITTKLVLIFQLSGQGKHFKKVTLGVPLFKNRKQTCFFSFF